MWRQVESDASSSGHDVKAYLKPSSYGVGLYAHNIGESFSITSWDESTPSKMKRTNNSRHRWMNIVKTAEYLFLKFLALLDA